MEKWIDMYIHTHSSTGIIQSAVSGCFGAQFTVLYIYAYRENCMTSKICSLRFLFFFFFGFGLGIISSEIFRKNYLWLIRNTLSIFSVSISFIYENLDHMKQCVMTSNKQCFYLKTMLTQHRLGGTTIIVKCIIIFSLYPSHPTASSSLHTYIQ